MIAILLLAFSNVALVVMFENLKDRMNELEEQYDMLLSTFFKVEIKKRDIEEVNEWLTFGVY